MRSATPPLPVIYISTKLVYPFLGIKNNQYSANFRLVQSHGMRPRSECHKSSLRTPGRLQWQWSRVSLYLKNKG